MHGEIEIYTSPQTWSDLRVLYESGEYANLADFYEKVKGNYPDMPPLTNLKFRCGKECWDKERFQEIRTEVKRRNLIELYASLGMGEVEQAKYRIECVKAVEGIKKIIKRLYEKLEDLEPDQRAYDLTLSKIKILTETMLKGMTTSLSALQDISKLTGDYAPVSTKDIKGHTYKSGEKISPIEDMSEEEIIQDLKRMRAAGIDLEGIEEFKINADERKRGNGA